MKDKIEIKKTYGTQINYTVTSVLLVSYFLNNSFLDIDNEDNLREVFGGLIKEYDETPLGVELLEKCLEDMEKSDIVIKVERDSKLRRNYNESSEGQPKVIWHRKKAIFELPFGLQTNYSVILRLTKVLNYYCALHGKELGLSPLCFSSSDLDFAAGILEDKVFPSSEGPEQQSTEGGFSFGNNQE